MALRMKTARAAAPRRRARRKARKVPEEARPEVYWVVMLGWMLLLRVESFGGSEVWASSI